MLLIKTACAQDNAEASKERFSAYHKPYTTAIQFQIGPSIVFFRGDDFYKDHEILKIGFSANIGFLQEFSSRWQVNYAVGYEIKGSKFINYSLNEDFNPPAITKYISDLNLNYVTVSLIAKYSTLRNRNLFFGCGPYAGYMASTKNSSKLYINGSLYTQHVARSKPDPDYDYRTLDFGLTAMAGLNVTHNKKRLGNIQLIYRKGMMDINNPMLANVRPNSISILFGITHNKKPLSP